MREGGQITQTPLDPGTPQNEAHHPISSTKVVWLKPAIPLLFTPSSPHTHQHKAG